MPRITVIVPLLSGLLILASCAGSAHQVRRNVVYLDVPPELEQQIDTSVTFVDLQAAPANYVGRVVKVGVAVGEAAIDRDYVGRLEAAPSANAGQVQTAASEGPKRCSTETVVER